MLILMLMDKVGVYPGTGAYETVRRSYLAGRIFDLIVASRSVRFEPNPT